MWSLVRACCATPWLIWMLSHCLFIFHIKLHSRYIVYYYIMCCGLFGRGYWVWDAWSTLDCKCVFFGAALNWIEDKRHTPLVAALSFRRSLRGWSNHSQRRQSLLSFSLYFFFLLSISCSHSVLFFLLFLLSLFPSLRRLPHPACLFHPSISLLSISVSPARGHSL